MSGVLEAAGIGDLAALLPALGGVFAGCVVFFWLLALAGCRILSGRDKTDRQ